MGKIIQGNFPLNRQYKTGAGQRKTPAAAYRLHVTLLYTEPLVWRRLQVAASLTLAGLHRALQLAMGWDDRHLHQFLVGDNFYGPADLDEEWGDTKALAEGKFTLAELEEDLRRRCLYEYDFGDGWRHEIKIEKALGPEEKPQSHPVLLAGARACPPEDIGGPPGYEDFLAALAAPPQSQEYQEIREWLGDEDFDPDFLPIAAINRLLQKMK